MLLLPFKSRPGTELSRAQGTARPTHAAPARPATTCAEAKFTTAINNKTWLTGDPRPSCTRYSFSFGKSRLLCSHCRCTRGDTCVLTRGNVNASPGHGPLTKLHRGGSLRRCDPSGGKSWAEYREGPALPPAAGPSLAAGSFLSLLLAPSQTDRQIQQAPAAACLPALAYTKAPHQAARRSRRYLWQL